MTPYTLLTRRLLSPELARPIGRFYFWPTYPATLYKSWKDGRGLWCEVDETVVLGVAPMSLLGHPQQLYNLGVRSVVNLQDEYGGPTQEYERLQMHQLWLPTIDHTEPSFEDLKAACTYIEQVQKRGERAYVHCKAGHGRGAAVALAWMIYSREVSDAQDLQALNDELAAKRRVRPGLWSQDNIKVFAEWIRSGKPETMAWEDEAGVSPHHAEKVEL